MTLTISRQWKPYIDLWLATEGQPGESVEQFLRRHLRAQLRQFIDRQQSGEITALQKQLAQDRAAVEEDIA